MTPLAVSTKIRTQRFFGTSAAILFCLCISLFIVGCRSVPEPEPGVLKDLKQKGVEIMKISNPEVVYVSSRRGLGEKTAVKLTRAGANKQVQALAELIGTGITRRVYIVVAGDHSALTRATIESALNQQVSRVPGLHLLFVGDEDDQAAIRDRVRQAGGKIYFEQEE